MILKNNRFLQLVPVKYPVIMAPMFLVSNVKMVTEALSCGITAAIPALNYRTITELKSAIRQIKATSDKPFGINLIVNKSNLKYKSQLEACLEEGVDYFITSLGNPKQCIELAHKNGARVFCDVTDLRYALKVEDLGADGVVAVNKHAGGHSGQMPKEELIPLLRDKLHIPIISAGGIANFTHVKEHLDLGAEAVSVGTVFIASTESPVSDAYKQALVDYGAKDVVMTTKMSGSPLTVIKTPYVEQIGTEATWLERLMNKHKWLKKYIKLFIALRGSQAIEKAAFKATYKTVWVAGPVIEYIREIRPVREIVRDLVYGFEMPGDGHASKPAEEKPG
ncbi:MAG: nitronate monooxygenase [Salibacteraceae bacterium]